MDSDCLTVKNPKIKDEILSPKISAIKDEILSPKIPEIKDEILSPKNPAIKNEILSPKNPEIKDEILSQSDFIDSDKDDDSDFIISDDDNDSDFEPAPKKKPAPKARKPAAKKTKAACKIVKEETGLNEDSEKKPPAKKRKTPVKRTKAVSKKIKTEDGSVKEEIGENEEGQPPTRKRKAPVKRTKAVSKKKKTEDGSINIAISEDAASADPSSSANNENSAPEASTCDISKIISNARSFFEPWKDEEVVAETTNVPVCIAKNVMTLLDQECTIPFIVRYRKEKTGGMLAEKMREIQASYDEVKQVHKKVENILKTVKSEKFDDTAKCALLCAKTLEEVEFLYAPFKPGSKRSLAERSKQLGLGPLAQQLLESEISLSSINFNNYIKQQKGLQNDKEILTGIQHIIADAISKDRRILDFVRTMSNHQYIKIQSTKSAAAEKEDRKAHVEGKTTENFKYENYFKLNILIKHVAHHQVMAVNRGEKNKVLTVKIEIPFEVKRKIKDFIWHTFFKKKYLDPETLKYLRDCVDDSYDRLIEPHICRQIRSDLSKKAEKESIAIFCSNVRSLLLTPPVRGKTVVGIDPGFSHGCKVAVVSSKGEVLRTDVIYPHSKGKHKENIVDGVKLKNMISTYGAEIIAIGNGTACRETEQWLSNMINAGFLRPFQIKYCIVNESGVSIYSVTKEAEAELPNMDPNIRSAVAIARRLQDPLLEYVKIEPKHLGVGMYQHDVPEAQLKKGLDSVVEECVSFVGVDVNVCPEFLLRKISGLSAARAKQIVEWRTQHGGFINRQQLREVKGLGPKSFEQCAGFVKVLPETSLQAAPTNVDPEAKGKKKAKIIDHRPNPLDRTIVHPESYNIAEKFLKELNANPDEVGMQAFVEKVNFYMRFKRTEDVAKSLNVDVPVMQLIIDAFKQLLDYDIRGEFDQPLFMTSVRKYSDLKVNQELTGRVMNIAGFGAFVDVGVERDGLIHTSKMNGQTLSVGERVTVKVLSIDFDKKRLGLQLLKKP